MHNTTISTETEELIKKTSEQNNEPTWLIESRLSSNTIFQQKPMPNFVYGLNIKLNLNFNLSNLNLSNLKLINKEIINSNEEIKIYNLKDLIENNSDLFKEKFMSLIKNNEKFNSFHNSFVNNILLIHIPENYHATEPIDIISKLEGDVNFDHLIVVAEPNSSATIIEELKSIDNKEEEGSGTSTSYFSKIVEIFADSNSIVNYGSLQTLNKKTIQFVKKLATTKNNSKVNWLDCCFGSLTTLSEVTTNLDGEGSETNNHGIFFGNESQQFDLVANSIHNSPNTYSDIFTKGALTDSSKCIYRGLVKINRNASNSNGYQQEDTLLLSPDAAADSIPDLEIDNSDVKCSHGATIGRIDEEKLFYLRSRGFNENQAIKTYVKGFLSELISKMEIKKLRENMDELIEERMN